MLEPCVLPRLQCFSTCTITLMPCAPAVLQSCHGLIGPSRMCSLPDTAPLQVEQRRVQDSTRQQGPPGTSQQTPGSRLRELMESTRCLPAA